MKETLQEYGIDYRPNGGRRCFMLSEKFSNFALLFVITSNRMGASQLRINKTCVFEGCFKLRLRQLQQRLKTQAISFTKCTTYLLCAFFAFSHNFVD